MTDRLLERDLRRLRAPDEDEAAVHAWELAAAQFDRAEHVGPRRRPARRLIAPAAAALCLAALAISPAGASVAHWVSHRFSSPGVKHAKPALVSLPAPGRLLVMSRDGAWIVQRDGSSRRLGPYGDAVWSPHGLFVAAVRGHDLLAIDPEGHVHWALARSPSPALPSWSPGDGFRIAYLSGESLHVVAGNGIGDHALARHVAHVRPAWRPGRGYVLSYLTSGGEVLTRNADSGRVVWRVQGSQPAPNALEWSPNGTYLLEQGRRRLRVLNGRSGSLVEAFSPPAGVRVESADISPDGRTIAAALYDERAGRSHVLLLNARARLWHAQTLFTQPGRFAAVRWSPNGRWLLAAWRDADQWVFLRSAPGHGLLGARNIGRAFEPDRRGPASFPSAGGWCCRP